MSTKQHALITGANKGIGHAIARQLGERGFAVWLGCRDGARGEQAAEALRRQGVEAQAVVLDVTSEDSVRAAAEQLGGAMPALDVLVNNAGMHFGFPPPASAEPIEQLRAMLETNTLGPLRVTHHMLPLLRKAAGARIVMMSSGLGSIGATLDTTSENWNVSFAGYAASKTALNMFTVKLAKELMGAGIKVNAVDPGLTATDLTGHMGNRTPDEAAVVAVELATIGALGPTGGFYYWDVRRGLSRHPW